MVAKLWVVASQSAGLPKESDFKCIEEEIPECQEGDFIIEAESWSVDPYIRFKIRESKINDPVISGQVARIIESKNASYPVGTYVVGYAGWRTHTYLKGAEIEKLPSSVRFMKLPELPGISRSSALGALGMPGNTAYFGFLDICDPKPGETVLVNAAAGAVGSLVCQIAKIKGCKVIGFAGSEDKVSYVKSLGADHVFNYKTTSVSEALKAAAPDGINCYFDNVGGQFTADVMPHMASYGRISVCGAISTYNDGDKDFSKARLTSPFDEAMLIWKQLRVQGFIVTERYASRWMEGIEQMTKWIQEGQLKYRETLTQGFENVPLAFLGLFKGDNVGKAVVMK